MYAIRAKAVGWYKRGTALDQPRMGKLEDATLYASREAALSDTMLLATSRPRFLGCLVVRRLRRVRVQVRKAVVTEWAEGPRKHGGSVGPTKVPFKIKITRRTLWKYIAT
jgi:hypothetical protein